jgi:hypothetical protein
VPKKVWSLLPPLHSNIGDSKSDISMFWKYVKRHKINDRPPSRKDMRTPELAQCGCDSMRPPTRKGVRVPKTVRYDDCVAWRLPDCGELRALKADNPPVIKPIVKA